MRLKGFQRAARAIFKRGEFRHACWYIPTLFFGLVLTPIGSGWPELVFKEQKDYLPLTAYAV